MNRRSKNLVLAGALTTAVAALAYGAQAAGMGSDMQADTKPMATQCDGMKDCKDDMTKNDCSGSGMGHETGDMMGAANMNGASDMHADCSDTMTKHDSDSTRPMRDPN